MGELKFIGIILVAVVVGIIAILLFAKMITIIVDPIAIVCITNTMITEEDNVVKVVICKRVDSDYWYLSTRDGSATAGNQPIFNTPK